MMIMHRNIRGISLWAGIILLVVMLTSCANPPSEITQGSSKDDVITLYGKPDRTQVFLLPEEPFFGPQESLINFVPSGTTIEEWVYEIGNEELYVWFTGKGDESQEDWLVLDFGSYPKGAVY